MSETADERPQGAVDVPFQHTWKRGADFRTWFRGEHTNYNPTLARLAAADSAFDYVLKGWLPEKPLIDRTTQITAFGSCFAANISNWLARRNFRVLNKGEEAKNAYVVTMGEGMVNSFVIRQQFEWAWENKIFEQALWHGYKAEEYGYDEAVRLETKRIFDETEVFILTFGLSEVWYDEPTRNVFWRTIPKDVYDPTRHKFRLSTIEENRENILAIYDLIQKHRPDAKVIVTLSPVPLIATFRNVSCITANSVSKATLRVALDEAVATRRHDGRLFYWPSYELVNDVFHAPFRPDRRHFPSPILDHIMRLFESAWCRDSGLTDLELTESWARANVVAGRLPSGLLPVLDRRRPHAMRQFLGTTPKLSSDDKTDKAWRDILHDLRIAWRAELNAKEAEANASATAAE